MQLILSALITCYTVWSCFMQTEPILQVIPIFLGLTSIFFLFQVRLFEYHWGLIGVSVAGLVLAIVLGNWLMGWGIFGLFLTASYYLSRVARRNQQLLKKTEHLERFVTLLQAERHKNYSSHALFQLTKNERSDVAAWLVTVEEQLRDANIGFQSDFQVAISDLPFAKEALIPLLTEILANAKQAAEQADNGWISWQLKQQSGLFLFEITNATRLPSQAVMDHLFRRPRQTSGAALIKRSVAKVHGTIDYRFDQGSFKLILKIPAIAK